MLPYRKILYVYVAMYQVMVFRACKNQPCDKTVETSTASTAMAMPLFDKVTNKFKGILQEYFFNYTYLVAFIVYVDIAITKSSIPV